jgi:hypothetical protein
LHKSIQRRISWFASGYSSSCLPLAKVISVGMEGTTRPLRTVWRPSDLSDQTTLRWSSESVSSMVAARSSGTNRVPQCRLRAACHGASAHPPTWCVFVLNF